MPQTEPCTLWALPDGGYDCDVHGHIPGDDVLAHVAENARRMIPLIQSEIDNRQQQQQQQQQKDNPDDRH